MAQTQRAHGARKQHQNTTGASRRIPDFSAGAPDADLVRAVGLHKTGDLDGAEKIYRTVLSGQPANADAMQFLGVVAHQRGDSKKAVKLLSRALKIQPGNLSCHNNLGNVYCALGDEKRAAFHFTKAAGGRDASSDALTNLGILRRRMGDLDGAKDCLSRAHAQNPSAPVPLQELAGLHLGARRYAEAEAAFKAYLALVPGDLMALNNLAYAVQQQGRYAEAERYFVQALDRAGKNTEIGHNLRLSLILQGREEEARELLREELRENPDIWTAEVGLALNLAARGQLDKGLEILDQILEALPERGDVYADIGLVYVNLGRAGSAIPVLQKALELNPELPVARNTLGSAYALGHRPELAIKEYKRAIKAKPDFIEPYINICRALRVVGDYDQASLYGHIALHHENYADRFFPNVVQLFRGTCDFAGLEELGDVWAGCDKVADQNLPAMFLDLLVFAAQTQELERFFDLVKRWASFRERLADLVPPFATVKPAQKGKLRIGFLSSDLRSHSVSRFLIPLMRGYDKDRFEFFCYMSVRDLGDPIQEIFKEAVDQFTFVDNRNFCEIAKLIHNDQVDILFDLNGFTEGSMVESLAFRPAPVQMSWLGYPFTSGLAAIDHVIMDRFVVPPGGKYLTEEPVLMPDAWVCFGKFADVPISTELPMDREGRITFGTLNNPYKYTPHMIGNWARVMKEVENSRFLMVRPEARSPTVCRNITNEFSKYGIDPERLYFFDNRREKRNHLAYYNEIDISLDTFPLTGGTTTCEAIWMGVPVVSLVGEAFHQRISYSALMQCGLEDLCTFNDADFIAKGIELAHDRDKLLLWRHEFRDLMAASPLCDQDRFVHQFQEMLEQVAQHHKLR